MKIMRRLLVVVLIALGGLGIWFGFRSGNVVKDVPPPPAGNEDKPGQSPFSREAAAPADELNAPDGTPQRDLAALRGLITQFTTSLRPQHRPPLGDNADITAALTGGNRLHVVFLPKGHPALGAQGRLVDRWGTPYWFHARGDGAFDVRSAGPDKSLFTADDVALDWR